MKNRVVVTARFVCAFVLFGIAVSFACRSGELAPVDTPARVVKDDLGRSVELPPKIERAVSLAPSLTEMIFAAGAGDRLVGVTTYCNYPAETAQIAKVGDTQTPNIERIVALKPQVVFVSTASQLEAFARTLEEQKIAVFITNPKSLDDILEDLLQLGELFGTRTAAERVVETLRFRIDAVQRWNKAKSTPRVFVQFSREPLYTIGRESFLTDLVEIAGGVSVTKDVPSAFPNLSKETALALDPDVIVLSDSEDNREPNGVFKNSKAVKNGRIIRVNPDTISRPGPRLVDALEQIARALR